jgi:hypothetical protein
MDDREPRAGYRLQNIIKNDVWQQLRTQIPQPEYFIKNPYEWYEGSADENDYIGGYIPYYYTFELKIFNIVDKIAPMKHFDIEDTERTKFLEYVLNPRYLGDFSLYDLYELYIKSINTALITNDAIFLKKIEDNRKAHTRITGVVAPYKYLLRNQHLQKRDLPEIEYKYVGTKRVIDWIQLLTSKRSDYVIIDSVKKAKPKKITTDIKIINHDFINFGFKSKAKNKQLIKIFDIEPQQLTKPLDTVFPLKQNKKYQLKSVYPIGTYLMDIFFVGKIGYLLLINGNSRFSYSELLNGVAIVEVDGLMKFGDIAKSGEAIYRALQAIINRMKAPANIRFIRGDGEASFGSSTVNMLLRVYKIRFVKTQRMTPGDTPIWSNSTKKLKTEPYHTSLSIIDRICRTIRDMSYNMRTNITPKTMPIITQYYNSAPHNTLTKIMNFTLTPDDVEHDIDLQEEIVKRINATNYNIKYMPGFELHVGSVVKVYNFRGKMEKRRSDMLSDLYTIIDVVGNFYELQNNRDPTIKIKRTRSFIEPV